ncbi:MAG: DNA replication and repair protein RecF [Firmicutes bacterium]|nr:DNA replication and repair protein RecF [Bacillota bacterium]
MYIKELQLTNFRNYVRETLEFQPGIYVIQGNNGQGKSNLLEAIYSLCFGRSFRNFQENDLVRWNAPYYYLQGSVCLQQRLYRLEMGYETQKKRKVVKIDGKTGKSLGLDQKCPLVCFIPEDLELIRRGPAERRRFMDREISQLSPLYRKHLNRYNRIVSQKNRALKEIYHLKNREELFKVWNNQLVYFGSRIIQKRSLVVADWSEMSAQNYEMLFPEGPRLRMDYDTFCSPDVARDKIEQLEAAFSDKIELMAKEEQRRGYSLLGPHRDDLLFLLDDKEARRYASHGQQRSAIIALKAAQLQLYQQQKEEPVFMLDDIFSELDLRRRQECFALLRDAGQVFLTITEKDSGLGSFLQQFTFPSFFLQVHKGRVAKKERIK